jgi:hypothetical protein
LTTKREFAEETLLRAVRFISEFMNVLGTQLDEDPNRIVLKVSTEDAETASGAVGDHGPHLKAQATLGEGRLEACVHPEQAR